MTAADRNHEGHAHPDGLRALGWALGINVLLTLVQVVGGVLSGSLALIADALHNLSDAGALGVALVARSWSTRAADRARTYGYGRAELIGAMINLTTLIIIGLYLTYEALLRWFAPEPVAGWPVIVIAGIALVIDAVTALLTWRLSAHSANIRAAFLHNVADALSSVGVMVAGALIVLFGWVRADAVCTLLVSGLVLYHGVREIRPVIRILMQSTPPDIDLAEVARGMNGVDSVKDVHHLHVWQMDETSAALEAHVVIQNGTQHEEVKRRIKALLAERFNIRHSTLELEHAGNAACAEDEDCHDPRT